MPFYSIPLYLFPTQLIPCTMLVDHLSKVAMEIDEVDLPEGVDGTPVEVSRPQEMTCYSYISVQSSIRSHLDGCLYSMTI